MTANAAGAAALGRAAGARVSDVGLGRRALFGLVRGGLAVALAVGMDAFEELLEGARAMDTHFRTEPIERNIPAVLALLEIWYVNFFGAQTRAVIPYCEDLRDLPAYLQQLEMESNGKRVDRDGSEVDYDTAPIVWGATGTPSQHSFHQLLHQGTRLVPVDFIVAPGVAARRPRRRRSRRTLSRRPRRSRSATPRRAPPTGPSRAIALRAPWSSSASRRGRSAS